MSKSKHTSGPWKSGRNDMLSSDMCHNGMWKNIYHCELSDGEIDGKKLPLTIGRAYGRTDDEIFANARLIAAAPELLAALEDAMRWFAKLEDWRGECGDPNIEMYRAAIKKATEE